VPCSRRTTFPSNTSDVKCISARGPCIIQRPGRLALTRPKMRPGGYFAKTSMSSCLLAVRVSIWPQLTTRWSVFGVLSSCGRQEAKRSAKRKAKYATQSPVTDEIVARWRMCWPMGGTGAATHQHHSADGCDGLAPARCGLKHGTCTETSPHVPVRNLSRSSHLLVSAELLL
jgi:hypothetical protein